MRLRYHRATISFCGDLLRPEESPSIPVGVLLLAEAKGVAVAMLAVNKNVELPQTLPEVVRQIVADFPRLVQAQLEQILHSDAGASIDSIMEVFEDSLRNSFHVSELVMNEEASFSEPAHEVPRESALYEPTNSLVSATIARSFEKPWWMDMRYRPWLLPEVLPGGRQKSR